MRLDQISLPKVETLLTGLAMGESPRWHENRLWFSDWGAQEIVAVDLNGNSEVIVRTPLRSLFLFASIGCQMAACSSSRDARVFSTVWSPTGR